MGVAAEIETSKIQGRAAFLHSRVIKNEKIRKETKKAYERPKTKEAAMIAIPRGKTPTDDLSRTTPKGRAEVWYTFFAGSFMVLNRSPQFFINDIAPVIQTSYGGVGP